MSSVAGQSETTAWWRSLDELADTPRFRAFLDAEFPAEADPGGVSRRRWLQVMGASLALAGVSGCRWEKQEIRPFVKRPDDRTPGKFRQFATTIPRGESALGLLATTVDGRPIKLEGNPDHPLSLGATDAATQAAILELYDPDRSQSVHRKSGSKEAVGDWEDFAQFTQTHFGGLKETEGSGLRILAEAGSSPTLDVLRAELFETFPQAQWLEYEPVSDDNERAGAVLAFGRPVRTHLALDSARVIVCLDADPLGSHPAAVRYARDFAASREPTRERMNRLYSVESSLSITGAAADHRLPLASGQIPAFLGMLERALAVGGGIGEKKPSGAVEKFLHAVVDDLLNERNQGRSVLCVGPAQPPEVHAAAHRINALLGNVGTTVHYRQVPDPQRPSHVEAIKTLTAAMKSGQVTTLLILGGNPAYDAPADLKFAEALAKVETTIHLSLYRNETSRRCTWHLPRAHFLESWGDARSYDGTYSVIQPMIAPWADGRSSIEVLAMILGVSLEDEPPKTPETVPETEPEETAPVAESDGATPGQPAKEIVYHATYSDPRVDVSGQSLVRRMFRELVDGATLSWQKFLQLGFLPDSQWPVQSLAAPVEGELPAELSDKRPKNGQLEVVFAPDASVQDGRSANNGWLQELPDPITRMTWDNAALIGPRTAEDLDIENETWITVTLAGRPSMRIPAYVLPGQAAGSICLPLGYGRTAAGSVGGDEEKDIASVGVDVYPLRTTDAMMIATGATIKPTGERYPLATTQDHFAIDAVGRRGRAERLGSLVRETTLNHYEEHPEFAQHVVHHPPLKSLWNDQEFQQPSYKGHRWGMAIDLAKCIGCGACVMACQAENNIPIVGKEQVLHGREMHWIRVDRYFQGDVDSPRVAVQPVPCQQCEMAPCEQVCPVAATVHSQEGLNDMVYNRCVGTRYCANNCPYKVRRFNYFNFHKDLDDPKREISKMQYNPEVTVRSRGVMEKCTYCVQRIQATKIEAKNAGRPIADLEIQTACQQVCPTGAIVFGDLTHVEGEEKNAVLKQHESDRAYAMLGELNVRPRTVYLAAIRNANQELEPVDQKHDDHTG